MKRLNRARFLRPVAAVFAASLMPSTALVTRADTLSETTYAVQHGLTVKEIPQGTKKVRIWFWVPREDGAQKILDFAVSNAPGDYKLTRDPIYGQQYLFCEVEKPKQDKLTLSTEFLVKRCAVSVALDPSKAGVLTPAHRQVFAAYLRKDTPHMEVTDSISMLAKEVIGEETNVVKQARLIYNYVIEKADHYSKGEGAPKPSKIGSVPYCRINGGGSCTDMHSLFIALSRAAGIPTRLAFGSRLQSKNEGKEIDPGYRCSAEFFAPKLGWIPLDVAAGDTNPDKKEFYFGGLDDRRILFNEGRDIELSPKQNGPRLNLFIGAYVEVDGQMHSAWERTMKFNEVKPVVQTAKLEREANR
jgi:transglutaminase-like putative cysteine protease